MTLQHQPEIGSETHADAIQRLDTALDDQVRAEQANEAAEGTGGQLSAGVELAAANEQVAARTAWLSYVEHGR